MRRLAIVLVVLSSLSLFPAAAHAQRYFSPFAGYAHGDAVPGCPSFWDDCPDRRAGWGVAFGSLSAVGVEQEISWTGNFFGERTELEGSSVLTLMSNVMAGIPMGPLRPYASFGIGLVRAKVDFAAGGLSSFTDNSFGYNYGLGVVVLLPSHLGVRVDFRRIKSKADIPAIGADAAIDNLTFSRASIGLVLH